MTWTVKLRKAASADVTAAYRWYEDQQDGLGQEFLDDFELALIRIEEGPLRFPLVLGEAQKVLLMRFPFTVFFRIRGILLRVDGVFHQSRDPRVWKRRVS